LAWDEISKATYKPWQPGFDLQSVKATANNRVAQDSVFKLIRQRTDLLALQNDKEYSLQIDQYKKEMKSNREAIKDIERLMKMDRGIQATYLKQDEQRYVSADKDKTERYKQWLTNISKDIYVDQAIKVVKDIVNQQNLARAKEPVKTF
jgi:carboxyl-terminal processing protease